MAIQGGGTVYWVHLNMDEPIALSSNEFINCTALYGEATATEGFSLQLPSDVIQINAYSSYIAPLNVTLLDYYGQIVVTESKTTVYMSAIHIEDQCLGTGYLTGGTSEIFSAGIAIYDNVEVHCQPNAYFNVSLQTSSEQFNVQKDFNFFLLDCAMGEVRDDELCVECPQGYYSFDSTATECLQCPEDAMCPGGDVMDVNSGYWRQTQYSHEVLACPNEDNCLGGTNVDEQCREGHEGLLCTFTY